MVVLAPSGSSQLLPFSAVTHQRLHRSAARPGAEPAADDEAPGAPFGQPLPGGRLAWAANGAALEVLCWRTGARRAAWTFGAHRPDAPPPQVTAVCGLSEAAGPAAAHLLAVGLDCGGGGAADGAAGAGAGCGMVCVLDVSAATVVRAIQLPHQVTALAVLRAPSSDDVCPPLREMGVVAAVGTHGGFVLLLDLALDASTVTDESAPGAPTYVTVLEPEVARRRAEQAALGNHLCLPLNDDAVEAGVFRHRTAHGRLEHAQPADDTWVSAVQYVPQLRSLVVGLSFGCFQVWNVETLQLEFASRYEPARLPVVGCVFLEPENDPRRFVYLWLLSSVPAYHDMNGSVASAALFALLYSERQWEQGSPVYRGLEQAGARLVYDLTTTPEQPDAGQVSASCLLSAFPLSAAAMDASGAGDDSLAPRDATCCALAWEAWTADGTSACTCLALFDLNRWYQAHMPHRVDAAALERCEYLRFYSLDARDGIVMGVSVRAAEPRDGLLTTTLLLDVGVLRLAFCAPEEQLLRALQAAGGAQLARPLEAYEAARRLGLVPAGAVSAAEQREALLSLALERGFSSLLAACAARWPTGDADPAGCSLRALLDWLWRRAVDVVTQIDAACVQLFDLTGGPLADDEVATLHALRSQLDSMGHVLDTMAARAANTDVGLGELESKSYVLRVRSLHAAVILWLCHAGLLPEQVEQPGEEPVEFAYPGAALAQWYAERRRQLGRRLLMVDGLVEELGEPLKGHWEEDGDGLYPPRSLQALTRTYLLDGVPDVRKHRLTHYLLMDLSRLVSDEHCDTFKSFPSSFAMSPSLIKLTHAFWHLDHGNVESALVFLMDPLVQPADLSAWQHRRIVESLLAQDAPRAALQYARARHLPAPQPADLKLHLRVLLDNGLVTEALTYERHHRALGGDELLVWLLAGCQQRQLLTQLMKQPLDTTLERVFVEFLLENADKECAELLHVFYLQRGRYREAASLQRRLAAAPLAPERANFRESLHQLLPGLTHRRDAGPRLGSGRPVGPGARRRPLSAQLHQVPATVRSRAIVIQELLEREGKPPPAVTATPFRPRHKRKLPDEDAEESGTPRSAARRPMRSDIRRLLQTPPVRRCARRSDVGVSTPPMRPPAAGMTPQSILKVRRYLDASGSARGEDTPSKQLRFGMLRGRRSLEESRTDVTPPPLATLFTPGKTPRPLRPPARTAAAASPPERSPSPAAATSVRLASLFTPGKTPRPLAAHVRPLPEPRLTMAEAWAEAERSPSPQPASPPRKRQSIASELDDSEFYSFEASPTAADQTVEIFEGERKLRLVERSWHDESDPAVTMGGDMTRRSRAGDEDDTVSEEGASPPAAGNEEELRHSTPQQEHVGLRSPLLGGRLSLSSSKTTGISATPRQDVLKAPDDAASTRSELQIVTPSPRRQLHDTSTSPQREVSASRSSVLTERYEAAVSDHKELHDASSRSHRELDHVRTNVHEEARKMSVVTTTTTTITKRSTGEPAKPAEVPEDDNRRESGSSGEFSPLMGNQFDSLAALTEGVSSVRELEALEAQVLTDASVNVKATEKRGSTSSATSPQARSDSAEDRSVFESPDEMSGGRPVEEPVVVKRTAWVTGEKADEEPPADKSTFSDVIVEGGTSLRRSGSYLDPPAGMQEALQRISQALDISAWPSDSALSSAASGGAAALLSSGSETADAPLQLRLESDSESEPEQEPKQDASRRGSAGRFTSLLQRPGETDASPPPVAPPTDRLSSSSVLRQPGESVDTPLLTPRRSLRRLSAAAAAAGTTETSFTSSSTVTKMSVEGATATSTKKGVVSSVTRAGHEKSSIETVRVTAEVSDAADVTDSSQMPPVKDAQSDTAPSPKRYLRSSSLSPKRSPQVKTSPMTASPAAMPSDTGSLEGVSPKGVLRDTSDSPGATSAIRSRSPNAASHEADPSGRASPVTPVELSHDSPVAEIASPSSSALMETDIPSSPVAEDNGPPSAPVVESVAKSSLEVESGSPSPKTVITPSAPLTAEITTPSASPVAKITTPSSSPPAKTSASNASNASALSPLVEEPSPDAPSPPAVDTVTTLPSTPSSVRRSGRRGPPTPATPRSRLSLLAAVAPLSPVPEGDVSSSVDNSTEPAAGKEQGPATAEPEEPVPAPASARKRSRRAASVEPERAPASAKMSSRSRAASVGRDTPSTPLRRSTRRRSVSMESEDPVPASPAGRGPSQKEALTPPDTPTRSLRTRRGPSEPKTLADDVTSRTVAATRRPSVEPEERSSGDTTREVKKAKEDLAKDEEAAAPNTQKSARSRKGSEEPERQATPTAIARSGRTRKASVEAPEPPSLNTTSKSRRTRKGSEEPESQSQVDSSVKSKSTKKQSEELDEMSVAGTVRKSRRTRKASEEPDEPSVMDPIRTRRHSRKASEEPEEHSVLESTQRSTRSRKASEGPEEQSILETTRKTTRSRKTSEPPEGDAAVQSSRGKRTRKQSQASESSDGPGTPEPAAKSRKHRGQSADDRASEVSVPASPARNTRARSLSLQPESPERVPTRAASEQPESGTSTRKRRPVVAAASSELSTPAAVPPVKRERRSSARKRSAQSETVAAIDEEEVSPEEAGTATEGQSSPLRRRVTGRANRSRLPSISEKDADSGAMPPPAPGSRQRRRRRPTDEEAGSPVVLLTDEQLEELRQREADAAEPEPVSRARRSSIARTRRRAGGRRSVRLW